MALTKTPIELSSTPSIVDGGNATAITIDSSENVMVGTTQNNPTSSGVNVAGQEFSTTGGVRSTVASNPAATFNRKTDDGSVILVRKDGATVGSIGTGFGLLTIGTGTGNLLFENALVAPCSDSSVGSSNGVVDLGASSRRFKDLYLSGGAYLGGTAAANKLEHYEEVAWTPTQAGVTLSVTKARAIRVGNLVTLNARISWPSNTDSTTIAVGGLPFTFVSTWEGTGSIMANNVYLDSNRTQLNTYLGGSSINFYETGSGVSWTALNNTSLSASEVIFTVSYLTS